MGYYGTAANLSMAVAPLLGVAVFNAYGFNQAFMAASVMALLSLAAMTPIREPSLTAKLKEPFMQPRAPTSPAHRSLIYEPAIFPALIALSMTLTYGGVVSFAPLLASHHNVNPGIFFAVYAGLLVIGRPLAGRLADAAGRAATIIPGMASLAVALGLLAFASAVPHFIAAGALYGIAFSLLQPSLMAMILDRAAAAARGAAMGTYGAAYELGIGMGSILLGLLLEKTSFTTIFLVASAIAIIGLVAFALGARKT